MFKALVLEQQDKKTIASIRTLDDSDLPQGDVTVAVDYSSLNYKDGLAITGKSPIVRQWPMVPGIDFAGTVVESHDDRYQKDDKVVLTGWGVGEGHWGGMSEKARVSGDWLVPMPEGLECSIFHDDRHRRPHCHALCYGSWKKRVLPLKWVKFW